MQREYAVVRREGDRLPGRRSALTATAAYMPIFLRSAGFGFTPGRQSGTWTSPATARANPSRSLAIWSRERRTRGAAAAL